jgi:hypothetical protein
MKEKRTVQPSTDMKMIESNIGTDKKTLNLMNLDNEEIFLQSGKMNTKRSATNVAHAMAL